jgi:hypothetical protein
MTGTMNDLPSAEIDWTKVLGRCVDVENWSDFHDEIYGSGVLLSDYNAVLAASELEGDELLELGTVEQLRAMLTEQVREDHFAYGSGEYDFWNGTFDEILAALAFRVGTPYDTPRRVLPCPTCGDKAKVQTVVFGMPAGPPTPEEEDEYYFAGCTDDGGMGDWFCPTCETFHSVQWLDPFEWAGQDAGPEQNDMLTADESGEL